MTPHRYFYVHIMKTGGTAFRRRLMDHFGDAIYPTMPLDGTDPWELNTSTDRLRQRLAERGDEIRLIAGHFTLRTTELIGGRFTTLTLLRDPVERVLSHLRSMQRDPPGSLEERYDGFLGRGNNNMTKMLSLTAAEMEATLFTRVDLDREHLERAKDALAGMGAVGLQERLEDFCAELTERFGWDLGEPRVMNVSPPADVAESLRTRIVEENPLDIELYEFAKGLVASRHDVRVDA
jgi:hypothetical protein